MSRDGWDSNQQRFDEDVRQKQRNIVFPDTVRNDRLVNVFLWNGSPKPTAVQRIAAWLFGLQFIGLGVVGLSFAFSAHGEVVVFLVALAAILLGMKIFSNGFPKKRQ